MKKVTLLLSFFSVLLALHNTETVYTVKDMEPITLNIDSQVTIRYIYTPIHNASPLLCINLTSYSTKVTIDISIGSVPLLSTKTSNTTAIPLETIASLMNLSDDKTSSAIDFEVSTTMPVRVNFTAGLFRQLIYGSSIVIQRDANPGARTVALANDGLHDILISFSSTTKHSVGDSGSYLVDLHSQPFTTKRESLVNPTYLLIRSVGNTYQCVTSTDGQKSKLTPPKHLFMESSFYYLTVNLAEATPSLTISYRERYQRFTPSLQIDYYNVPIHYTVDISDYQMGSQILMSSTCLDVDQATQSPITICLRYDILDADCSLNLQNSHRYAWMTVQDVHPPGYLSSIYVSKPSQFNSDEASTTSAVRDPRDVNGCKVFLTNVNFINEHTDKLSFIEENNRNKATLLIAESTDWIKDSELIIIITLRPFREVSIKNFHPYVQFFLSNKIVYPNETHNSLAYVMNFQHISGNNYEGSSVIPTYLESIANKSAVFKINLKDISTTPSSDSIYIKLEHSVDLDLLFLRDTKPNLLRPGLIYGSEKLQPSSLNSYYIDSGHTTGISTISGYLYYDVCTTSLFLSDNGEEGKKPLVIRLSDNMDQLTSNFLDITVPMTKSLIYVPIYSAYATFVRIFDAEYVPPDVIPYKIGYLTKVPTVTISDARVRIRTGIVTNVVEIDSAKAPVQKLTADTKDRKDSGIYIAYAVYLVQCAYVNGERQNYPSIPISRCGMETALTSEPKSEQSNGPATDTSPLVYRVSDWVVTPAADNIQVYTPEFIAQAENTWSMIHIDIDIPAYIYEPYYLVVVAAVDTYASNTVNQPQADPVWGHTIDKSTIQFYEARYLSSSFSDDEFISFVGYHSSVTMTLLIVFWSVAALILLVFIVTISLFLTYKNKYDRADKRAKKFVQLVHREHSIEYSPSRLDGSEAKQDFGQKKVYDIQMDHGYSSMDNMSSQSLPLIPYSPSQSAMLRNMTILDQSHPFSKDMSSQDSALDHQYKAARNKKK